MHIQQNLDPTTQHPIIDLLPEQKDVEDLGGTLRLRIYPCKLTKVQKRMKLMEKSLFMNVIVIVMSSIMNIVNNWKQQDLCSLVQAQMVV